MGRKSTTDSDVYDSIIIAQRYFNTPKYSSIVDDATEKLDDGDEEGAALSLKGLPTTAMLMELLLEKLKDKAVYHTLKRIVKGYPSSKWAEIKAWSSLCTHIVIECEAGNTEYVVLLKEVYSRLTTLVNEI